MVEEAEDMEEAKVLVEQEEMEEITLGYIWSKGEITNSSSSNSNTNSRISSSNSIRTFPRIQGNNSSALSIVGRMVIVNIRVGHAKIKPMDTKMEPPFLTWWGATSTTAPCSHHNSKNGGDVDVMNTLNTPLVTSTVHPPIRTNFSAIANSGASSHYLTKADEKYCTNIQKRPYGPRVKLPDNSRIATREPRASTSKLKIC